MRISEWAVRRAVTTTMVYALFVLLGLAAFRRIPLEFMPAMDIPFLEIWITYEGASPVEVCDTIVEPVEEAISTMHGIKRVRSRCRLGRAQIGVEMTGDAKADLMALEMQERIDQIRPELPADLGPVVVFKWDTEQFPVIFASVAFPEKRDENADLMENRIVRELKTVDGVANVQAEGIEHKRVTVEVDQDRLLAYQINVLQVTSALISSNFNLNAGSIEHTGRKYSLRIVGEFQDLDEIRRLPITAHVRLSDVASVRYEYVRPLFFGRMNGKPAYMLIINKEADANTVEVCRRIHRKLDQVLSEPQMEGVQVKPWFDQSREILTSIHLLTNSGLQGGILAILILFFFLRNLRSTAIISISIPTALIFTLALMYFVGLSFNIITISAMVLGVGMLVDNSIVILEAILAKHQKGADRITAAIEGAKEVGLAITVSTTTTLIVFLPLVFTEQSQTSILMEQLGLIIGLSIGGSLLVSLTLIPLLASRWMKLKTQEYPAWYQKFSAFFLRQLRWCLDHRALALAGVMLTFFLALGLLFSPLIQKEAVPAQMMRIVQISLKYDREVTIDEINEKLQTLEKMFMEKMKEWDIETVAGIVSPSFAHLTLVLPQDRVGTYTADQIREMAKQFLAENVKWPGIRFDLEGMGHGGPGEGPPTAGAANIKVRGDEARHVYYFAEEIRERLKKVEGIKEIKEIEKTGQKEIHIEIDRDLAKLYGFDVSQVALSIAYSVRGSAVGQMNTSDRQLDIYFKAEKADDLTLAELAQMNLQNLAGEFIPLKNIAAFRTVDIPEAIRREDRRFSVTISIIHEKKDLGQVRERIAAALKDYRLPRGYTWVMGEEYQEMVDAMWTLGKALMLAMVLVFLIMCAQFESVFLPFVIMFTLPFSLIGVVIGLLVSGSTFNALSGAGCLLLVGIVVNNAIVLVDHVHNLRKQGFSERESLLRAAEDRLRPIMMTAFTTMMGLLPMALGFNDTGHMIYSPLAIAVLGGLFSATYLTPTVIPIVYSLSDDLVRFFKLLWVKLREA